MGCEFDDVNECESHSEFALFLFLDGASSPQLTPNRHYKNLDPQRGPLLLHVVMWLNWRCETIPLTLQNHLLPLLSRSSRILLNASVLTKSTDL